MCQKLCPKATIKSPPQSSPKQGLKDKESPGGRYQGPAAIFLLNRELRGDHLLFSECVLINLDFVS